MEIRTFTSGFLGANCYVVVEQNTAIVIDPIVEGEALLAYLQSKQATVAAIINTHGHVDHIAGNQWLHEQTGTPIQIHQGDEHYLTDPNWNLSALISEHQIVSPKAARLLQDGSQIKLADSFLTVIHTPGHSPGSICLLGPGVLFTGDTLFQSSIGRSDFPGGDSAALRTSLQRLKQLPMDTVIYPGHGSKTTLEQELNHNPFLR